MIDFSASWAAWLDPTPAGAATAAARAAVRTVALIGLVSAVIDTILGAPATVQAFKQGDMGGIVGSAVVTVGSAAMAFSFLRALISGAMGGPWSLIAMVVVAIGYAIKTLFAGETSYQKLVGHCEWGIEYGEGGAQPDWAPAPFKDWKDNFDAQVIAALNPALHYSHGARSRGSHRESASRLVSAGSHLKCHLCSSRRSFYRHRHVDVCGQRSG